MNYLFWYSYAVKTLNEKIECLIALSKNWFLKGPLSFYLAVLSTQHSAQQRKRGNRHLTTQHFQRWQRGARKREREKGNRWSALRVLRECIAASWLQKIMNDTCVRIENTYVNTDLRASFFIYHSCLLLICPSRFYLTPRLPISFFCNVSYFQCNFVSLRWVTYIARTYIDL